MSIYRTYLMYYIIVKNTHVPFSLACPLFAGVAPDFSYNFRHAPMPEPTKPCPAELALREYALEFPEAVEEFPWGERVVKVNRKVFVFLSTHKGRFYVSVKLPESNEAALRRAFAKPTGYGLGKSSWVSASFDAKSKKIPLELLRTWIDESFR